MSDALFLPRELFSPVTPVQPAPTGAAASPQRKNVDQPMSADGRLPRGPVAASRPGPSPATTGLPPSPRMRR